VWGLPQDPRELMLFAKPPQYASEKAVTFPIGLACADFAVLSSVFQETGQASANE